MAKIEAWDNFPPAIQKHLAERMRDRSISLADLNRLRLWIESCPEVPEGEWYKDFGSFMRIPTKPISQSDLMPISAERSDAGLS